MRWIVLAFLAIGLVVGGARCQGGADPTALHRSLPVIMKPFGAYSDDEVVDMLELEPDVHVLTQVVNLYPVDHPKLSSADCGATPDSIGCRIRNVKQIAVGRGVAADKLCMSFRGDVYRKLPGWPAESYGGIAFDPDWVMRMPGDLYQQDLLPWRGGVEYYGDLDRDWVEGLEDACCHDAVPDNCTASDRCVQRYGTADDVTQVFSVSAVVVDLRHPEYWAWSAAKFVAKLEETGADCSTVSYKPGYYFFYGGEESPALCFAPGSNQFSGPTLDFDPCAGSPRQLSATLYGPGEAETAINWALTALLDGAEKSGRGDAGVLLAPPAPNEYARWEWLSPAIARDPQLLGDRSGVVHPFGPPPPTTSVLLLPPPPREAVAPLLDVDLHADARGGTTGPVDFHFWCDCLDDTEDPAVARDRCGTGSGSYYEIPASAQEPVSVPAACDYPVPGTYYPKVIAVRGGKAAEDRIAVDVDSAPSPL